MKKFSLCLLLIGLISVQVESFQRGFLNRYVREPGHGTPRTLNHCCKVEETEDEKAMINKNKESMEACFNELYGKDEKPPKHAFVCVTECVAKKNNIFDNGKLDDDAFTAHVKETAEKTERLKAIAEGAAKKCLEKAKDPSTDKPNPDGMKCSQQPIKAFMCIHKEFLKSCPPEAQDQSEKCVKFREKIEKDKPEGDGSEEKKE